MSVHVFLHQPDIKAVYYRTAVATQPPMLTVEVEGATLYIDVPVIDLIVALGQADQARQQAAVQP